MARPLAVFDEQGKTRASGGDDYHHPPIVAAPLCGFIARQRQRLAPADYLFGPQAPPPATPRRAHYFPDAIRRGQILGIVPSPDRTRALRETEGPFRVDVGVCKN